MLVEVLSAIDTGRQTLAAGVIADLPDDEAGRLVAAGLAREVGVGGADSATSDSVDAPVKTKRKG